MSESGVSVGELVGAVVGPAVAVSSGAGMTLGSVVFLATTATVVESGVGVTLVEASSVGSGVPATSLASANAGSCVVLSSSSLRRLLAAPIRISPAIPKTSHCHTGRRLDVAGARVLTGWGLSSAN